MFHKNNYGSDKMCEEKGVIRNPTKQQRPNTSESGLTMPISPKKECEHKWILLESFKLVEFIYNYSFYCEKCLKTKIIQLDHWKREEK